MDIEFVTIKIDRYNSLLKTEICINYFYTGHRKRNVTYVRPIMIKTDPFHLSVTVTSNPNGTSAIKNE